MVSSEKIPPAKPVIDGARAFVIGTELLTKVKKQVQVATAVTTHDTELSMLIEEAGELLEYETPWVLAEATFDWDIECWPDGDRPIEIPKRPVNNVDSITYFDENESQQTLAASDWRFDDRRVWPSIWRADFDTAWPDLASHRAGLITVRFSAGYQTADDLPNGAVLGILARVARVWHDRGFGDLPGFGPVFDTAIAKARSSRYLT